MRKIRVGVAGYGVILSEPDDYRAAKQAISHLRQLEKKVFLNKKSD